MSKSEKYLKKNSFPNIAIRNKAGIQAYMLSDILDDYAEQQIKELKEDLAQYEQGDIVKENEEYKQQIKELKELLQAANDIISPACEILPETYNEEIDAFLKLKRKIDS